MAEPAAPAQATPQAGPGNAAPTETTPEQLHDAAIAATEAWQTNPTDEALKTAAKEAVTKAKTAAAESKQKAEADRKTAEEAAAKNKPPKEYQLTLPQGSPLGADHLTRTAAYARERGLTQDQAQALATREHEVVTTYLASEAYRASQEALLDQKAAEWLDTAKADKEIGGDAFGRNAELAKRVVARYGSDTLQKALSDTGLGSHPELVRMLVRIGQAMTEDQLVLSSGTGGETTRKSTADILYGKSAGGGT